MQPDGAERPGAGSVRYEKFHGAETHGAEIWLNLDRSTINSFSSTCGFRVIE